MLQEWALLKAVIYEKYAFYWFKVKFAIKLQIHRTTAYFNNIFPRYDREIPLLSWKEVMIRFCNHGLENIFKLIDIILCLPPTSVNNECTFSAIKLCKGKRRGRMKVSTLNDLLTIQIQSESVENFDPDQAIKHWMVSSFLL